MSLTIIPVPIGNLKDITLRAIDALTNVDFIVVEDTRYSLKLLNHLGIRKKLLSYYKPKEEEKSEHIIKLLLEGQSAGLITDSGTPAISDPGFILVRKAIEAGIEVISLPGPTAFVPALVASGIEPGQFLFLGFPPRKVNDLKRFLREVKGLPYTLIFYESPRRAAGFLKVAANVLGSRRFALVKELSKKNEKVIRGDLSQLEELLAGETLLGEMVIIIEGSRGGDGKSDSEQLQLNSLEELFTYFKETHNISKNQLKRILMKRERD
ncbi:MAG: 16S rRNA (cytidine(1402)-2'-O)-methyltransferase [bacterium]|nr:16S rRNA (cytidine(1402)-2'-O)-methyltransferase [bacterium]